MQLWLNPRKSSDTTKEFWDRDSGKSFTDLEMFNDLYNRVSKLEAKDKELEVMIHYHNDKYPGLMKLEKHGNFYDVRSAVNIELKKDVQTLIPLGISLYLPDGYYAELLPRSSTFKNFGFILANSMGIIDDSYRSLEDMWMISALPMKDMTIRKNDRIGQFTIVKETPFILKEGTWEAKKRGGFGASGKQ